MVVSVPKALQALERQLEAEPFEIVQKREVHRRETHVVNAWLEENHLEKAERQLEKHHEAQIAPVEHTESDPRPPAPAPLSPEQSACRSYGSYYQPRPNDLDQCTRARDAVACSGCVTTFAHGTENACRVCHALDTAVPLVDSAVAFERTWVEAHCQRRDECWWCSLSEHVWLAFMWDQAVMPEALCGVHQNPIRAIKFWDQPLNRALACQPLTGLGIFIHKCRVRNLVTNQRPVLVLELAGRARRAVSRV